MSMWKRIRNDEKIKFHIERSCGEPFSGPDGRRREKKGVMKNKI
jgi:hypothetical protein